MAESTNTVTIYNTESTTGLTFDLFKDSTSVVRSFKIARSNTSDSKKLRWTLNYTVFSNTSTEFKKFYDIYEIKIKIGSESVTVGSDNKLGIFSRESTNGNLTWDVNVEVVKKEVVDINTINSFFSAQNLTNKIVSQIFSLSVTTSSIRQSRPPTIAGKASLNPTPVDEKKIFFEVIPCSYDNINIDDESKALLPCGIGGKPQDCRKLKYILLTTSRSTCDKPEQTTNENAITDDDVFKFDLNKATFKNGRAVSECYRLKKIPDPPNVTAASCCNTSFDNECSIARHEFKSFGKGEEGCKQCTNDSGKHKVLDTYGVGFLSSIGWLANFESIQFSKPIEVLTTETAEKDKYVFSTVTMDATTDLNFSSVAVGSTNTIRKSTGISTFNLLDPNQMVDMDAMYYTYSVQHMADLSVQMAARWKAKFKFDLQTQLLNRSNFSNSNTPELVSLSNISNLEVQKSWIEYVYNNFSTQSFGINNKQFAFGATYSYQESTRGGSPEGSTTSSHDKIEVFFEIKDLINLFSDGFNDQEEDFKERAYTKLRVGLTTESGETFHRVGSENGTKGSEKLQSLIGKMSEAITQQVFGDGPAMLSSLFAASQKIKSSNNVLSSINFDLEHTFLNGSTLSLFRTSTQRSTLHDVIRKNERNQQEFVKQAKSSEGVSGIKIKLDHFDGVVLSCIGTDSGNLEVGVSITKNFRSLKNCDFLKPFSGLLSAFREGEVSFFSGLSFSDYSGSDGEKKLRFNSGLTFSGQLGGTLFENFPALNKFLEGFHFDVGYSLVEGIRTVQGSSFRFEKIKTIVEGKDFHAKSFFTFEANSGAFTQPYFTAGIDVRYQRSLVTFGNVLGSLHVSAYAYAVATNKYGGNYLSTFLSIGIQLGVTVTWRNSLLSYLGFPFDIHPKYGAHFGIGIYSDPNVSVSGVTSEPSGTETKIAIPLGIAGFDFVLTNDFRKLVHRRHVTLWTRIGGFLSSIVNWIPGVGGIAGAILETPFDIISHVPILRNLGPQETIFQYFTRVLYVKSYLDFVHAVESCEKEINKKIEVIINKKTKELNSKFEKMENFVIEGKRSPEEIIEENDKFLNYIMVNQPPNPNINSCEGNVRKCHAAFDLALTDYIGSEGKTYIDKVTNEKIPLEGKTLLQILRLTDSALVLYKNLKESFINKEVKDAITEAFKDPKSCDCVRKYYEIEHEYAKTIYAGMASQFPQLAGDYGIINLFFSKMSNVFYHIFYEVMLSKDGLSIMRENDSLKIDVSSGDFLNNKKLRENIFEKIKLSYAQTGSQFNSEAALFQYIINFYKELHKTDKEDGEQSKPRTIDEALLEALDVSGSNQGGSGFSSSSDTLGKVIRRCLLRNGKLSVCQYLIYEWIRYSKILGKNISIGNLGSVNGRNIKQEGTPETARTSLDYMKNEVLLFSGGQITNNNNGVVSFGGAYTETTCGCTHPYIRKIRKYIVNESNINSFVNKSLFFLDPVVSNDLKQAKEALSFISSTIETVCIEGIDTVLRVPDIIRPTKESIDSLVLYKTSSSETIKATGTNPVSFLMVDVNEIKRIKKESFQELDDVIWVLNNMNNINFNEILSDWFVLKNLNLNSSSLKGPFSNVPWTYKNPYTDMLIDVRSNMLGHIFTNKEGDIFKNGETLKKALTDLINELKAGKNHASSQEFSADFNRWTLQIQKILRELNVPRGSIPSTTSSTAQESLSASVVNNLNNSVIDRVKKDVNISIELLKQVTEAELNAVRDQETFVLKNLVKEMNKAPANDIPNIEAKIGQELRKRLFGSDVFKTEYDLRFLFDSSLTNGSLLEVDSSIHSKANENIGLFYSKKIKGVKDPKNIKLGETGENNQNCKKARRNNSPHPGEFNNAYKEIDESSSPFVDYKIPEGDSVDRVSTLTDDCNAILLNGIHGKGSIGEK